MSGEVAWGTPVSQRHLALADRLVGAAAQGAGELVFVAGPRAGGRSPLLTALGKRYRTWDELTLLAGRFTPDGFVPAGATEPPDHTATREVADLLGSAAELFAPLLGKLITLSAKAMGVFASFRGPSPPTPPDALVRLLKAAAQDRPVLCVLDDLDQGVNLGWWDVLRLSFAKEIHEDYPILLFLGLEGPERLRAGVGHSDAIDSAASLERRGLAQWWWVDRIEPRDVRHWLGRAEQKLIELLVDVGMGHPQAIAELWGIWRERGLVEQDADQTWRQAPGIRLFQFELDAQLVPLLRELLGNDQARQDLARG